MMIASVVLPAVLFAFAAWLNYRHEHTVADDRIGLFDNGGQLGARTLR